MRKIVTVLVGAALSLGLGAAPAQARGDNGHAYWQGQHTVTVNAKGVHWTWGVKRAIRQWNYHRPSNQPRLVLTNSRYADVQVRVVRRRTAWTGLTTSYWSGSRMTGSTVYLNAKSVRKGIYRVHGRYVAVKRYTTSHEFGHVLGLDHHQHVLSSVMSYATPWWRTQGRPSGYDRRLLNRIY